MDQKKHGNGIRAGRLAKDEYAKNFSDSHAPLNRVQAVIEADRHSGTVGSLRSMTRGEWELALDFAVTGSRQLTLSLDQP